MADMMIESTNTGYHWAITCQKSVTQRGVAIVSALEGVLGVGDGYRTFETAIFQSRMVRDVVPCARLTPKRKDKLLNSLVDRMRDDGLIN